MYAQKSSAGQDGFSAYEFFALLDRLPQIRVLRGVRREIGMAGLGSHWQVPLSVPKQIALAQTGSCGDDYLSSLRSRDSRVNSFDVLGFENRDGICGRFEVIQQTHIAEAQMFRHGRAVDYPWQVRATHSIVHHRAGNPERSVSDFPTGAT